ncbi:glycosyl transferase family 1 [Clostridium sp. YIM B02555]|uniref:glycosyl transferase family 1 n=1 Tax=Clostridium sp. YIM B02555 TaxID=2911968 RepID=UPI001EED34EB|nr:glycosyl transferase family 1 [Clostridium sp. YIM B02555]
MKKILLGFYKGSAESYISNLEKFEIDNFEVHIFDNLTEEDLKEFNLENILINTLGEKIRMYSINIISNNEELILNLYNQYTLYYNAFIFDNSIYIKTNEMIIEKYKSYNYGSNLYSIKEWDTKFEYSILNDNNVNDFGVLGVKNFINASEELFKNMNEFSEYYPNIWEHSDKANQYITSIDQNRKEELKELFKNTFNSEDILFKIYMGSFLITTFKAKEYGKKLLDELLKSNIDKNQKYYIMYQLISIGFTDTEISNSIEKDKIDRLYDSIFDEFKKLVGKLEFIPKNDRNKDVIVVFISQLLKLEHGPTKTVLDRCYILSKYLNKKVILINTKELITVKGDIPFFRPAKGNIVEEYSDFNNLQYKDIEIGFYQPKCSMPDENECINILNFIKKEKPYLLINIGGWSITADLAAQIIPMATISTSGNYSISKNKGQFFIMGRKPLESDYEYIAKEGHTKEAIIECPFTFELKPQEHEYMREELKIPREKFVIAVVGGRLNDEIDDEFLGVLNNLASKDCFVVTIGNFKLSEENRQKYLNLQKNFMELGFQNDILACVELVDLYINPRRQGGGTSAVECMFKGKPALSLRHGDVSIIVDEAFICETYKELIDLAIRCKKDKDFYLEMSREAKARAADMMDTKKYFVNMYNDIINSPIFK